MAHTLRRRAGRDSQNAYSGLTATLLDSMATSASCCGGKARMVGGKSKKRPGLYSEDPHSSFLKRASMTDVDG